MSQNDNKKKQPEKEKKVVDLEKLKASKEAKKKALINNSTIRK